MDLDPLESEEAYNAAEETPENFADPSTLPGNQIYCLTPDPLPTAIGLLDGSHAQAVKEARSDNVFYLERSVDIHNQFPSFATVLTSGGSVGPFLLQLATNQVLLDDADGYAFGSEPRAWTRTTIRLDVRCLCTRILTLSTNESTVSWTQQPSTFVPYCYPAGGPTRQARRNQAPGLCRSSCKMDFRHVP